MIRAGCARAACNWCPRRHGFRTFLATLKPRERLDIVSRTYPQLTTPVSDRVQLPGRQTLISPSKDTALFSWGYGELGTLGLGGFDSYAVPQHVDLFQKFDPPARLVDVCCSWFQSYAVDENGIVYKWGHDFLRGVAYRTVKDTHRRPAFLSMLRALGFRRSLSSFPQAEEYLASLGIVVKTIAAGEENAIVCAENGDVYQWGADFVGTFRGSATNPVLLKTVSMSSPDSITQSPVIQVGSGLQNSMVLTEDGRVFSWGMGHQGQTGIPRLSLDANPNTVIPFSRSFAPEPVLVFSDALLGTDANKTKKGRKRGMDSLPVIKALSCGARHSVLLTDDGKLYTVGRNIHAQCGHVDWRSNYHPRLLELPGKHRVLTIATGQNHSLALDENGVVWSWGQSTMGQCGRPRKELQLNAVLKDPVAQAHLVPMFPGPVDLREALAECEQPARIASIHAGFFHSAAITENGEVIVWGGRTKEDFTKDAEEDLEMWWKPRRVRCFEGLRVRALTFGWRNSAALVEIEKGEDNVDLAERKGMSIDAMEEEAEQDLGGFFFADNS